MKPRKNYRARPKKTGAAKKQRVNAQKRKLIDSGYDADMLDKMTTVEIRDLLKVSKQRSGKVPPAIQKVQRDASKRDSAKRRPKAAKKAAASKPAAKKK